MPALKLWLINLVLLGVALYALRPINRSNATSASATRLASSTHWKTLTDQQRINFSSAWFSGLRTEIYRSLSVILAMALATPLMIEDLALTWAGVIMAHTCAIVYTLGYYRLLRRRLNPYLPNPPSRT